MPKQFFERLNQGHQAIAAGTAFLVSAYGAYAYWGLFRWLAELQIKLFGLYEVFWSFFFAFLILYLVFAVLLAMALGPKSESGLPPRPDERPASKLDLKELANLLHTHRGQAALLSVGFIFVAAYQYYVATSVGPRETVRLGAIESGTESFPAGRWWAIQGKLLFKEQRVWTRKGTEHFYVPLVSDSWQPGQAVKIVVELGKSDLKLLANAKTPKSGLSDPSGIPGDVVAHWQNASAPISAETALLVYGDSPDKRYRNAQLSLVISLVTGFISAAMFWFQRSES